MNKEIESRSVYIYLYTKVYIYYMCVLGGNGEGEECRELKIHT